MSCSGVTYTRTAVRNPFIYEAPFRDDLLADGFITGTTEPEDGVNVGAGVFGRPTPDQTIVEGDGIALGPNSTWTIGAGITVRDRIIPGRVVLGEGAILRNCVITGPPSEVEFNTALITGPDEGTHARVLFCTIDPDVASPYYDGIQNGLIVQRSWITNITDGVRGFNQTTGRCRVRVEGTLIDSLTQFTPDYATGNRPETHNDCAQMQGNPNGDVQDIYFDGCKLNARHSTTKGDLDELHRAEISALMLSPNVGSIHMTFTRGWLLGGIFCVNAGNDGLSGSELVLTDSRFERPGTDDLAPDVAFAADTSLTLTESDNVYIDNGEPVPVTGG